MGGGDTVLVRLGLFATVSRSRSAGFLLLLGVAAGCAPADRSGADDPPGLDLPETLLWTWQRPEDLSFLAAGDGIENLNLGVAALVATVDLAADGVGVRPNLNPLRLPDAMPRVAVVRLENPSHGPVPSRLEPATGRRLLAILVGQSRRLGATGLQIDFDALASQRGLYADLLRSLRPRLPAGHSLGITALASWCVGDPWLDDLPAGTLDYAVPMLFRMGRDAEAIRAFVDAGREFSSPLCRHDVGLSTDEPWPRPEEAVQGEVRGARRWLFHPEPWDAAAVRETAQGIDWP